MPEISRFFRIVITMYYTDHALPHFHAKCGGSGARKPLRKIDPLE